MCMRAIATVADTRNSAIQCYLSSEPHLLLLSSLGRDIEAFEDTWLQARDPYVTYVTLY